MIWIYVAAAIFGGSFVIPAIIGGLDFDTDMDVDFDADLDVGGTDFGDAELEVDLDPDVNSSVVDAASAAASAASGVGDWVASLLTFRTLVFASTFFGLVGMVFTWLDYPSFVTFAVAVVLGVFAAVVNGRLMAYLKQSGSSGEITEQHLRGSIARVVLPVGDDRKGRVELDVAGQPMFMSAQPYRDGREDLSHGEHVVVVEVKQGTAFVMAAPELGGGK